MSSNGTPITVVGNLTGDPELRYTPQGTAVAGFSVAVNLRRFDKKADEWVDDTVSFHRVTVWRTLAENVAESLHKGDRVVVTGTIKQRHWEDTKTGEKRSGWEVLAEAVGAELGYATAKVARMVRTGRGEVAPDDPWATASKTRPEPAEGQFADDEPPF